MELRQDLWNLTYPQANAPYSVIINKLTKHATQKNTVILTRKSDLQGYHHH